jgi:hypothetical protein
MELVILTARENPSYFRGDVWRRPYARAGTHITVTPQQAVPPSTRPVSARLNPLSGGVGEQ